MKFHMSRPWKKGLQQLKIRRIYTRSLSCEKKAGLKKSTPFSRSSGFTTIARIHFGLAKLF